MHYDSITSQPSGLESQDIFFLLPIHYAAIFHKIYGVSGHSLEIQLYFHLPLRLRLLKKQLEKKYIYPFLSSYVMFNDYSDAMFIAFF